MAARRRFVHFPQAVLRLDLLTARALSCYVDRRPMTRKKGVALIMRAARSQAVAYFTYWFSYFTGEKPVERLVPARG
jgi:hypothetical protein